MLQYLCLENPTDTEAWWATVHEVTTSQTQPSTQAQTNILGSQRGIHTATCKAPGQPGLNPYDQFQQPRLQMQGCGLNAEPPGNIMGEAGSPSTIPGEEAQAGLLTF